ncbi:reverse transcriptase domain-containing protein [Vallitaleaceae bacterium 9-2]
MKKELSKLKKILLSEKNIYKAILSLESYIFNPQLLDDEDVILFNKLNDKFNWEILFRNPKIDFLDINDDNLVQDILTNGGLIEYVRRKIKAIIDSDSELFKVNVHFKIKDISEKKYRPLHSGSIIDSIAMVSMLHILIFDMTDDSENYKMKFSNLSKLIPNNFYGNIPSKNPERLFEKWQNKYKEYSEITNEKFTKYHESNEYKSEIVLDLVNFFPSVNPKLVFDFIIKALEVRFDNEDFELLKIITYKLLIFEVKNFQNGFRDIIEQNYYDQNTISSFVKIDASKEIFITKGIPQGLPQSYFFGNLIMVNIAKVYKEVFAGEAYFYVDDSVLYIKEEMTDTKLQNMLSDLNALLEKESLRFSQETNEYFKNRLNNYSLNENMNSCNYKIEVHEKGKSHYQLISDTKIGYMYLLFMSRLASMGSFDMGTTFDDNQEIQLSEKFSTVIKAIDKEVELSEQKRELLYTEGKCECENCDECKITCVKYNNYTDYMSKLYRFKRFFQYRVFQVQMQKSDDTFDEIIDELAELEDEQLIEQLDENILEIKLSIINQLFLKKTRIGIKNNDKIIKIYENLRNLETKPFNNDKNVNSVFYYNKVFSSTRQSYRDKQNKYKNLEKMISRLAIGANKHRTYQEEELKELLSLINSKKLINHIFEYYGYEDSLLPEFIEPIMYWTKRSRYLLKLVYNAYVSLILGIELNDNFFISRKTKRLLNYYELRIVLVVRNVNVDFELLVKILNEYLDEYKLNKSKFRTIDYSIFEALYYFRTFVKESKNIDDLILIHKYTAELWENGSKYMHFYTLHNQSHAIELIESTNSILKSIDYLKISKLDYYILYAACYLHDISMVLYPNYDKFYDPEWNDVNKIIDAHLKKLNQSTSMISDQYIKMKESVLEIYKNIEGLFEAEVRDKHAYNSAKFIRKSNDLNFINAGIIDHIADVSYGHGMDSRNIYHLKSNASDRRISLKFMMILLRLADLLDMNENRVSLPIFYNNKKNMSVVSRFHWISHLITGSYMFKNDYQLNEKENSSYLRPKAIKETITLVIDININQLTTVEVGEEDKCSYVGMENYTGNNEVVLDIKSNQEQCNQKKCNFICKWFNTKNKWLINELSSLQVYLNDVQSYFDTSFEVKLVLRDTTILRPEDFDDLKDFIS